MKSEVAALMQQIEEEAEAGRLALYGLAQGTARHAVIIARTERLGQLFLHASEIAGKEAQADLLAAYDAGVEKIQAAQKDTAHMGN